jgi:hypothetical protein
MSNQAGNAEHRAAINRENALKSTGPASDEGKERSRFNAFRHGLTGQTVVLPWEDRGEYETCCKRLAADLKPSGAFEEQLVQTIADCTWRLNRAAAAETNMFAHMLHTNEFLISTGNPQVDTALCLGHAFREDSQVLANMAMYAQRISRQRDKAYEQLRGLQTERRAREERAMEEAASFRKLNGSKNIAYDPAEDGFVFSVSQIDAHIRRQARRLEAARLFPPLDERPHARNSPAASS